MADALDAVLNLVAQDRAQQQQIVDNNNAGVQLFNQQRQAAQQNQLGLLQVRAGLAQNALELGPNGSISYNSKLMNPTQQFMMGLQGQAAAKTAGNPQAYQMYSGMLNRIMGAGQNSPIPGEMVQSPATAPQTSSMMPAMTSNGSNTTPVGSPQTVNGMLTLGQSSTTDPFSGVTSTSQNQVNLPAQAMQATQAAQIPGQVAADKAATEAQTQADAGAHDYKNIYELAHSIDTAGYLGNPATTSLYKMSPRLAPKTVQSNITELETAIQRENQASAIANTATYGEGVAKRMSAGHESIGKDSTIDQIKGWIKGNITSDFYKEIGTKQFSNELAKKGLNPNQITPDEFGAGVMKYWGKLTPDQDKELKTRIMTTLAPKNAAGFGLKSGKYYDAQGKEIK